MPRFYQSTTLKYYQTDFYFYLVCETLYYNDIFNAYKQIIIMVPLISQATSFIESLMNCAANKKYFAFYV